MKVDEIGKNISREDKLIAAVNCETSESMINDVLAGRRNAETKTGRAIVKELRRLAKINIAANGKKNKRIMEAACQLDENSTNPAK